MIFQVYFDEESKRNCSEGFTWYENKHLTEFFENQVIVDLYTGQDLFGVFSHDIDFAFKEDELKFSPENLNTILSRWPEVEVFSFQKRRRQKNIVAQAENYHKGIVEMTQKVLDFCDMGPLPAELPQIVLFNYLIARPRFWDKYLKELLIPAMQCLKEMPEAYQDAGYSKLTRAMTPEKAKRFKEAFGVEWYPYHPFICERLPSIFLRKHKFNFKHIF